MTAQSFFRATRTAFGLLHEAASLGRLVLRDRGSKLGTFVNGDHVSVDSGKISAELKQGENDLVFGTYGSPHHDSIFIE